MFIKLYHPKNTRISRMAVMAISLVLICASGYLVGLYATYRKQTEIGLFVAPENLYVGAVSAQERFEHSVVLKNVSSHQIQIQRISSSCTCTHLETSDFSLDPGKAATVHMVINLENINSVANEEMEKDFAVSLFVEVADRPASPLIWTLTGRVICPYRLGVMADPSGQPLIFGAPYKTQSVLLFSHRSISKLELKSSKYPWGSASINETKKNGKYILSVVPDGSLSIGVHDVSIPLVAIDWNGAKTEVTPVRFRITVLCDFYLLPGVIALGAVESNAVHLASCEVLTRSRKEFRILPTEIQTTQEIRVRMPDREWGREGAQHCIHLEITPRQDGHCSTRIVLRAQYRGIPDVVEIPIHVSCQGTVPHSAGNN